MDKDGTSRTCWSAGRGEEGGRERASHVPAMIPRETGQRAFTYILLRQHGDKREVRPIIYKSQKKKEKRSPVQQKNKEEGRGKPQRRGRCKGYLPDRHLNSAGRCDLEAGWSRLRRSSATCVCPPRQSVFSSVQLRVGEIAFPADPSLCSLYLFTLCIFLKDIRV